jgi:hypothetical protein
MAGDRPRRGVVLPRRLARHLVGAGHLPQEPVQALIVVTTLAAAVVVLAALHAGLVAAPDPLVAGADSGNHTIGFDVDRVLADAALPRPAVLTAPDWAWRLAHLAWAAWLGWLLLRVGRFAWAAFTRDGVLGPLLPPALVRLSAPVTRPAGTVALDEEDTVRVVADAAGLPEGEPPRAPADARGARSEARGAASRSSAPRRAARQFPSSVRRRTTWAARARSAGLTEPSAASTAM